MDTFKIKCFCTLARLKNFTATGEELHISQPAVSKNISTLEQELGVKLVIRNTHGLELTAAGEYMLIWFLETSKQYEARLEQARFIAGGGTEIFNVGILIGSRSPELTSAVNLFCSKYPDITLTINTYPFGHLFNYLKSKKCDLVLCVDDPVMQSHEIQTTPLFDMTSYFVFSNSNPLSKRQNLSIADFKNETFLISNGSDKEFDRRKLVAICMSHGFTPKIDACSLSIEAAFGMAESGLGIICSDSNQISNYASNPRTKDILHFFRLDAPLKYIVAWMENSDWRVSELVDILRQQFKSINY